MHCVYADCLLTLLLLFSLFANDLLLSYLFSVINRCLPILLAAQNSSKTRYVYILQKWCSFLPFGKFSFTNISSPGFPVATGIYAPNSQAIHGRAQPITTAKTDQRKLHHDYTTWQTQYRWEIFCLALQFPYLLPNKTNFIRVTFAGCTANIDPPKIKSATTVEIKAGCQVQKSS